MSAGKGDGVGRFGVLFVYGALGRADYYAILRPAIWGEKETRKGIDYLHRL